VTDLLQDAPDVVILASDEAHVWAQSAPYAVWSPVGETPVIRVSPQRDRVVFYGALNLRSGQEHAIMTEKMNQKTTATFLEYLLAHYPDRRLLLLVDRASWHQGKPVEAVLAQHPRLELFYLPTACPDLNPQEHVWAAVRRLVTTAASFLHLVTTFLTTLRHTCFRPILFEHYAPPILSFLTG
jgi:transposase